MLRILRGNAWTSFGGMSCGGLLNMFFVLCSNWQLRRVRESTTLDGLSSAGLFVNC